MNFPLAEQQSGKSEFMNILLLSAGRRVQLLRALEAALVARIPSGVVVAADAGSTAPAMFLAEGQARSPLVADAKFQSWLVDSCTVHRVGVVIPTIDSELTHLASARYLLAERGVRAAISSLQAIEIAADKLLTASHLAKAAIPSPKTVTAAALIQREASIRFPAFLKPRRGSMSKDARLITDPSELQILDDPSAWILQEILNPPEFTVSVFVGTDGRSRTEIPRKRLEVRGGEVSKAVTVRDSQIQELARLAIESLPGAFGPLNVQVMFTSDGPAVVEINARFGGGDPLAWAAGADIPGWLLDELQTPNSTARFEDWTEGLLMTRFDQAVYVGADGRQFVG